MPTASGQTALKKKAQRALVQDAMGWSTDAMVRPYGGWVSSETAAAAMPEFAPLLFKGRASDGNFK